MYSNQLTNQFWLKKVWLPVFFQQFFPLIHDINKYVSHVFLIDYKISQDERNR